MNHYERLKVSQDAPAEVIRAAYRALAAKLHPDRGNGPGGPEDEAHTQMAALNAAYEVLIDPKLRREYDATLLAPSRPASPFAAAAAAAAGMGVAGGLAGAAGTAGAEPEGPSTRVDLNWVPPGVATSAQPLWPPSRRMMLVGGSALAVLIVGGSSVMWQVMGQHRMEQAMSTNYTPESPDTMPKPGMTAQQLRELNAQHEASVRSAPAVDVPEDTASTGEKRRPSVEELARMSDAELLKVLPTLDDGGGAAVAAALRDLARNKGKHPLDGTSLSLRTDSQIVEPIPAEQPPARKSRK
ncbi:MAG: J domain-containing protein [Aquabacterium sp.]